MYFACSVRRLVDRRASIKSHLLSSEFEIGNLGHVMLLALD